MTQGGRWSDKEEGRIGGKFGSGFGGWSKNTKMSAVEHDENEAGGSVFTLASLAAHQETGAEDHSSAMEVARMVSLVW